MISKTVPSETFWLIHYEDAGLDIEVFNDEDAARRRSKDVGQAWTHTLFVEASELDAAVARAGANAQTADHNFRRAEAAERERDEAWAEYQDVGRLLNDECARVGLLEEALRGLLQTWDDSADDLGAEWNGLAKRIAEIRRALAGVETGGQT